MGISKANATWEGALRTGKGTMRPAHGSDVPFTAGSRFEGQPASNPEEMIGAALAGCFSMALSLALEKAGGAPKTIRTAAAVKLEREGEGFSITSIELTTDVDASGLDEARFQEIAEATKKACPVSKALAAVPRITLTATLAT